MYLAKLLPKMIDNAFRIAVDPIFPPPRSRSRKSSWLDQYDLTNKFELVFAESEENRRKLIYS